MKLIPAYQRKDRWKYMRQQLYNELDEDFQEDEMDMIVQDKNQESFIVYDDEVEVGMLELSLRNIVDSCLSSPVAYLEGIYLNENLRGRGYGKKMIALTKAWAEDKGCIELASDAELTNVESQQFHEAVGFEETYRVVQYRMGL